MLPEVKYMQNPKIESADVGRVYGGESADQRIVRRRQKFLAAGLELFGTIGYRAVTLRALCKQAQLTDRYFYESFDCIEDLLVAVYHHCMENLKGSLLEIVSTYQPGSDVRDLVRPSLGAFFSMAENPLFARVCFLEVLGISPRVDKVYNQSTRDFAHLILGLIRIAHPRWSINDQQGAILALAMIGAVSEAATGWLLDNYAASKDTMITATSPLFIGILNLAEEGYLFS